MSRTTSWANKSAKIFYQGTPIANVADNAATAPLTSLYLALHTASPGEAGTQATSECAYTSYARVAVARSSAGFTVTNNVITLTAVMAFPTSTGVLDNETATFFSVGTLASGAGEIIDYGPIPTSILIEFGTEPKLGAGTTITYVTTVAGG
jgi:hypothetical protein